MLNMLNGYKTYTVATCGVLYAVFAFFTGHIDANGAVELMTVALGLAGVRNAID